MSVFSDEFDNEWLCPYCTALTEPGDKQCPRCYKPLIQHRHLKVKRSVWLWRGIFFQYVVTIYTLFFGAAALTVVADQNGISNPFPYLPLYFWLPIEQPEETQALLLAAFPRWIFWVFVALGLYSFGLMVMLYGRLRNGNLLYLVNAGLLVSLGITGLFFFRNSLLIFIISVVGALIGIIQLGISFMLWRDFNYETVRLRLAPDRGPKDHLSLYENARKYGRLGMWGLAVIHLRRAVASKPNQLRYQLALAVAYTNIKRYDLAKQSLEAAGKIAPNAPEVLQLTQKVAALSKLSPNP